ncbi:MAG: serine/threonine protein kinase [Deltaproteobacteria bacterium]|nr:serine/threonine protein kinase [Deltaproteobacteria bacterium]
MGLSQTTAKSALEDGLDDVIADVTGLARTTVRRRLRRAHGSTHVRTVFDHRWPMDPESVGRLSVAVVRRADLFDHVSEITGISRRRLMQKMRKTHGRTLLENVFGDELWSGWDDDDEQISEVPNDARDRTSRSGERDRQPELPFAPIATALRQLAAAPPSGELIRGRYRLGRKLGSGGYGVVYEALDTLLDQTVAIKRAKKPEHQELLLADVQLSSLVHHSAVCRTWLDRDDQGGLFVIAEHGGRSASDLLEETGPLAPDFAIDAVDQIAGALDAAHERQILHLDVSCGNILVDDRGHARLTDFGASRKGRKVVKGVDGATVVATAAHLTRIFAAPELLYSGQARARSDQYSLAYVLVALLRGRIPSQRYEGGRVAIPNVLPAQRKVILRALSLKPEDRWPTCGVFAEALLQASAEEPDARVQRRAQELLERLHKVVGSDEENTLAYGHSMKVAGSLEAFLRAVALVLLEKAKVDEDFIRKSIRRGSLDRATCAELADVIRKLGDSRAAKGRRHSFSWVVEDLGKRRSILWRAIEGRNALAHGRSLTLPAPIAAGLLEQLQHWVREEKETK